MDEFCNHVLDMTPEEVFADDEIPKAAERYIKWLQRSLTQLDAYGTATTALKNFEKLPGTDDIYSARYPKAGKIPESFIFTSKGKILFCCTRSLKRTQEITSAVSV